MKLIDVENEVFLKGVGTSLSFNMTKNILVTFEIENAEYENDNMTYRESVAVFWNLKQLVDQSISIDNISKRNIISEGVKHWDNAPVTAFNKDYIVIAEDDLITHRSFWP